MDNELQHRIPAARDETKMPAEFIAICFLAFVISIIGNSLFLSLNVLRYENARWVDNVNDVDANAWSNMVHLLSKFHAHADGNDGCHHDTIRLQCF
ncbi:MAG: hypothetical protein JWQ09_2588 [Segetibacter sp.]|nr:hypothetical protein [Segetibacter sp.]